MQNQILGALLGVAVDGVSARHGYPTNGEFTRAGQQSGLLAYSAGFEHEADYLSLYMLARAGYTYNHVPEFWRRMSLENPESIYLGSTHPSNAKRYVVMKKTITEIDQKRAKNLPLIPEFKRRT